MVFNLGFKCKIIRSLGGNYALQDKGYGHPTGAVETQPTQPTLPLSTSQHVRIARCKDPKFSGLEHLNTLFCFEKAKLASFTDVMKYTKFVTFSNV